jgi:hypothetical protein
MLTEDVREVLGENEAVFSNGDRVLLAEFKVVNEGDDDEEKEEGEMEDVVVTE